MTAQTIQAAPAKILRSVRTHWFGMLVATLGSLVFFWASIYQTEISEAFPFYWGAYVGRIAWHAVVFWIGVAAVAVMIAVQNMEDDEARKELVDATEKVSVLVQTLPPKGWREDYASAVVAAADALHAVLPRRVESGATQATVEGAIVILLNSIASLAFRYDAQPLISSGKSASYAANVMLFVPTSTTAPFIDPELKKALRFVPIDFDLQQLTGVLKLIPELTYSTAQNGKDTVIPAIALPIPKTVKASNGHWKVLPGAPLAFVGDGVDGYADSASLSEWFERSGDFPGSVRDEVREYFAGPGVTSRSFVSRRLMSGTEKLGVLNLHSNLPNLLGVREAGTPEASVARREEFFAILTPLMRDLEDAVQVYRGMLT